MAAPPEPALPPFDRKLAELTARETALLEQHSKGVDKYNLHIMSLRWSLLHYQDLQCMIRTLLEREQGALQRIVGLVAGVSTGQQQQDSATLLLMQHVLVAGERELGERLAGLQAQVRADEALHGDLEALVRRGRGVRDEMRGYVGRLLVELDEGDRMKRDLEEEQTERERHVEEDWTRFLEEVREEARVKEERLREEVRAEGERMVEEVERERERLYAMVKMEREQMRGRLEVEIREQVKEQEEIRFQEFQLQTEKERQRANAESSIARD